MKPDNHNKQRGRLNALLIAKLRRQGCALMDGHVLWASDKEALAYAEHQYGPRHHQLWLHKSHRKE